MVERIKNVASSSIKKVKAINWKEKKTRRILIITGVGCAGAHPGGVRLRDLPRDTNHIDYCQHR